MRLMASTEEEPVNLGNPGEFTMLELAEKIRTLTGSSSPLMYTSRCPPTIRCVEGRTSRERSNGSDGVRQCRSTSG